MQTKIRHMVVFNTKYGKDDPRTREFIEATVRALGGIPYAREFSQVRQYSAMCPYDYGFVFDFETQEDYDAYNAHPDHQNYLKEQWAVHVKDFMEVDFEDLDV
jgi:hypothetical protein